MRNESGFTLIEIIVSLVLVGMMAAIAGMGIVTGTKGYLMAKENSHMAQKAQLAMARIQRELMELTGIANTHSDPEYIVYDNTSGRHAIARDDTTVRMYDLGPTAMSPPMGAGDILVDNVHNFTLSYYRGLNPWNSLSDNLNLLSAIEANLELDRTEGSGNTVTFTTTVNPRNTNNYGGVPPTAAPFTAQNYNCFVATAASGEASVSKVFLFAFLIVAVLLLNHFFVTQRHKGTKGHRDKGGRKGTGGEGRRQKAEGLGGWESGRLGDNKGNVLIGLIVTMMIFAALGAGMVAMTGTSTSSQVTASTTSKAYYLAESGFRYAASEYLNATDILAPNGEIEDDRNRVLENLDSTVEFTLSNPDERFRIDIFPYYFVTSSSHNMGDTTLDTDFPGTVPDNFSMPGSGRLQIGSHVYNYNSYNSATGEFSILSGLLERVGARMNVLPVGNPSGAATMTNGGNLTLSNVSFFPAITGKFMIGGIAYTYATINGNILQNITDANDTNRVFSISVDANTNLVLKPYLKVHSTGTVGHDDEAASRRIVYNVPIPDSPTEGVNVELHDQFDDTSNWNASVLGSHAVQDIGGNALRVTGTDAVSGAPTASLVGLNWSNTDANLASAHSLSGYFLSYDAQVKVGFVPPFTPGSWSDGAEEGNGPDGFPKYYAAGLSFRLDQNNNSYGVSFLRGSTFAAPLEDNIDPDMVPQDQISMIVLWQQTNSGSDREWLAYKYLTGPVMASDDMETGAPGWDNSQRVHNQWTLTTNDSHSASNCWTDSPGVNYDNDENAWLITPPQNFPGVSSAVLTFWHKYRLEDGFDFAYVDISTDGGSTWNPIPLATYTGSLIDWERAAIDISDYLPNITVRFRIETDSAITRDGWYIDDVAISEGFPVNESTLLVRIKEAAEVRFNSGGTTPIEDGDIITQANGARGTVVGNPILSAGSWAAGNAVGIITLNRVSGTFISGQAILVGGSNLATCQGFTDRNNYIKVFYGDVTGYGTANSDPFDIERLGHSRNEIHWPPDEIADWSAERDFFTLVQWDGVNSVDIIDSIDEPGVIVLGTESSLFTPDSGILSYTRPELGLHTFGHGSTNVYFDDFGLQVEIAAGSGFLTPIQE